MNAAEELVLKERVTRLEVIAEQTAKTLELMQRRMDDGFKEVRADLRWVFGIQATTLLALIGILAKAIKLF